MESSTHIADFDAAAAAYDKSFTTSEIGKLQRDRVYFWLEKFHFFKETKSVFEINCGTGYDAQYFFEKGLDVTATDGSGKMIETAKEKRNDAIEFFKMGFNEISFNYRSSDAIFSNFGGLNCLSTDELAKHLNETSALQKSGDRWIGVLMPKYCFVESLYFLMKFNFKSFFRRNKKDGVAVQVDGVDVMTYYHSPREVKRMLKANYRIEAVKPVAFFLPPSYMESFFEKRLRILRFLNRLETLAGYFPFLAGCSDHYILIARKK